MWLKHFHLGGTPPTEQFGSVEVAYPSGFNKNNCVIISCGHEANNWGPSIINPDYDLYNYGPIGWGIQTYLSNDYLQVDAYFDRALGQIGKITYVYFRLVLMKIS